MWFRQASLSLVCLAIAIGVWATPLSAQPQAIAPPVEVAKVFPDVHLRLPDWVEPEIAEAFGKPATLVIKDAEEQMRFAIWLSRQNVEHGTGGPFGAAIFEIERAALWPPVSIWWCRSIVLLPMANSRRLRWPSSGCSRLILARRDFPACDWLPVPNPAFSVLA